MFISFSRADARNIAALRSGGRRRGLRVEKARGPTGPDNVGGLRIIDSQGHVVAGQHYDLTIREARQHVRDYPAPAA